MPRLMKWHLHSCLACQVYPLPLPEIQRLPEFTNLGIHHQFLFSSFIHAPMWEFIIKSCPEVSQLYHVFVSLNHMEKRNHAVFTKIPKQDQPVKQKRKISRSVMHVLYALFLVLLHNYKNFCY